MILFFPNQNYLQKLKVTAIQSSQIREEVISNIAQPIKVCLHICPDEREPGIRFISPQ